MNDEKLSKVGKAAIKLETIENVNQDKHTEDIQIVKSEENGQQNLLVND